MHGGRRRSGMPRPSDPHKQPGNRGPPLSQARCVCFPAFKGLRSVLPSKFGQCLAKQRRPLGSLRVRNPGGDASPPAMGCWLFCCRPSLLSAAIVVNLVTETTIGLASAEHPPYHTPAELVGGRDPTTGSAQAVFSGEYHGIHYFLYKTPARCCRRCCSRAARQRLC